MHWRNWGLNDNPYHCNAIDETNFRLFVGREKDLHILRSWSVDKQNIIFIVAPSGAGSTAIGNYFRFTFLQKQIYFTPNPEFTLSEDTSVVRIASNILASSVMTLRQMYPFLVREEDYKRITRLVEHLDESVNGTTRQGGFDREISSEILAQEALEACRDMVQRLGFERGFMIQMKMADYQSKGNPLILSSKMRKLESLLGLNGFKWLILSSEYGFERLNECQPFMNLDYAVLKLEPLQLDEVKEILNRRVEALRFDQCAKLPLDDTVIEYLYAVSRGYIRPFLEIADNILMLFSDDHRSSPIAIPRALPVLKKYFQNRIYQKRLSPLGVIVLKYLARGNGESSGRIALCLGRRHSNISRILSQLVASGYAIAVSSEGDGRSKIYKTSMEGRIAFGCES